MKGVIEKMNRKLKTFLAITALLVVLLGTVASFADSYIYSISGEAKASPDAYTAQSAISSLEMGLTTALNAPTDIETDSDGNVYIADPNNNRIVVLDEYYHLMFEISAFNNDLGGGADSLKACQGVFVWEGFEADENGDLTPKKYIYVADTGKRRIVVFDDLGNYVRIISQPTSDIFDDGQLYSPIALAVDSTGRLFVVSGSAYQGILSLSPEGEFEQFVGAQKAAYSAWQLFWRRFQSAEARASSEIIVSKPYNNITIDEKDFIYITQDTATEADRAAAINNKSADYAPARRLNTAGTDIMKRNGFFAPAGEVDFRERAFDNSPTGVSNIVDVALGPEGIWSIIDSKRARVYTYDSNGELLFAFGDTGEQTGNNTTVAGITYQGEVMLVLDSANGGSFTPYTLTNYGNLLLTAIKHNNDRLYSLAEDDWRAILRMNNNFDAAYIGLAKAFYRQGRWEDAMDYYKIAYNTEDYSTAFAQWRKEWLSKYLIVVPIAIVVICVAVVSFFKYAGKVNKRVAVSTKKRTLWEELLFAFHLIFHPFDGFWDLKHEKRGSLRAALIILGATVLCFAYQAVGQSYLYSPNVNYTSIFIQLSSLLVPLVLFVTANWCLTTLFEGEGSFKDVFIASCYSLTPIVLILPAATALTHVVTSTETGFITLATGICYVWLFFLLFFGTMVTHDYSMTKNIGTILGTILGMVVIMFLCALFSNLLIKMVSFVSNLISELQFRM